ncbi:DUF4298 domain-containing protein [bacterium]|nr:DUF4298 domain-containing protein [bacterium]
MEKIFKEVRDAWINLDITFAQRTLLMPQYQKLIQYYESIQRKKDYNEVNCGKLKLDIPHGILSEDAIYNLDADQRELFSEIQNQFEKFFPKEK